MGLSKKDAKTREHKAKVAAGTAVATTAGGVPKKAPKEQIQCTICKAMLTKEQVIQLRAHADAKHPKSTPTDCFPGVTF